MPTHRTIPALADYRAVPDHDRAYRDLSGIARTARKRKRVAHVGLVGGVPVACAVLLRWRDIVHGIEGAMNVEFCTKMLAVALMRTAVLVVALVPAAAIAQGAGKADGARGPAPLGDAPMGARKAAQCLGCHRSERPAPFIPALQGQPYDYLSAQMRAFQKRDRSNQGMHLALATLSMTDVRDIARYLSGEAPLRVRHASDPARVSAGSSRAASMQCASCHGAGFAGGGQMARIAGQHPDYIAIQLDGIRAGKRMHPDVTGLRTLGNAEIDELAQYIGSLN